MNKISCSNCSIAILERNDLVQYSNKCKDNSCSKCSKKNLCDSCLCAFYSEDQRENVGYCQSCYEAMFESSKTIHEPLAISDVVSLHWLKKKELNNTFGVITSLANEDDRYGVQIESPTRKILLVKRLNIVKLADTVAYHSGLWVCSFCGAYCSCGAFEEGIERKKGEAMHTHECHHYMNTLRKKGPDCCGYEPMVWDCCMKAGMGCEMTGKDGPFEDSNNYHIYPGDMKFRFGPDNKVLSDEQRRAAAKQAEVDLWEKVKAGHNPF